MHSIVWALSAYGQLVVMRATSGRKTPLHVKKKKKKEKEAKVTEYCGTSLQYGRVKLPDITQCMLKCDQ